MHKWRNGVLLLNYPLWFYGDEAQYSYGVVKQLRESSRRRKDGRPLLLSDIADAVTTLTDAQMKRLAKEFPQIDYNQTKRPIFLLYKKYPAIHSSNGMAVDLNMLLMMKQLKLIPPITKSEEMERIRIVEDMTDGRENRRLYRMQFQTSRQKTWKDLGRFYILSADTVSSPDA